MGRWFQDHIYKLNDWILKGMRHRSEDGVIWLMLITIVEYLILKIDCFCGMENYSTPTSPQTRRLPKPSCCTVPTPQPRAALGWHVSQFLLLCFCSTLYILHYSNSLICHNLCICFPLGQEMHLAISVNISPVPQCSICSTWCGKVVQ